MRYRYSWFPTLVPKKRASKSLISMLPHDIIHHGWQFHNKFENSVWNTYKFWMFKFWCIRLENWYFEHQFWCLKLQNLLIKLKILCWCWKQHFWCLVHQNWFWMFVLKIRASKSLILTLVNDLGHHDWQFYKKVWR